MVDPINQAVNRLKDQATTNIQRLNEAQETVTKLERAGYAIDPDLKVKLHRTMIRQKRITQEL